MEKIKNFELSAEQRQYLGVVSDILDDIENFADGDLLKTNVDDIELFEIVLEKCKNILNKCCEIY